MPRFCHIYRPDVVRLPVVAVALFGVQVCLAAQKNPYKIDDTLFALYTEAYKVRMTKEGLVLADQLYSKAKALGDGKAMCLARSVTMFYYYYNGDDEHFFRAVKDMQNEALRTKFTQYYYFGITNSVNYLINQGKLHNALVYVKEFERKARAENDYVGLFFELGSLANVHIQRSEISLAVKALREALELGNKYAKDQDMATLYRKLADCYGLEFEYQLMYDTAMKGYAVAKTKTTRMRLLRYMAFAKLKLQDYAAAAECCRLYEKESGSPLKPLPKDLASNEVLSVAAIAEGDIDNAYEHIGAISDAFAESRIRLFIELARRIGDYEEMACLRQYFYGSRIFKQDSVNLQDLIELSSQMTNQRLLFDNQHLALEHRLVENERQRAELDYTNLELAHTKLSVANSSLELGRMRDNALLMRLAYDKKKLQTQQLKSKIREEQNRKKMADLYAWVAVCVALVLLVAGFYTLRIYRRVAKRLRKIHSQLSVNHKELTVANEMAQAADRAKTSLIQDMDRDINIPLNSVAGFAQLIADSANVSPEERTAYFQQIRDNTDQMLAIVKDVLDKVQKS